MKKFFSLLAVFLLVTTPAYAYHTETQTPYGITNTLNNDGSITVSWQESDGLENNPPEYYIVYIGLTETADDKSVQTKFGFIEALSWQSYTFTAEYLYNELSVDNQKIYAKVKAFHDTNDTTSDFTPVESVLYNYVYIPTTTTSSTTTTTTTLPKAEDVVEDGITTYLVWDENGCEHPDNPLSYKEYLTAIESKKWFGYQPGDCKEPVKEEVAPTTTTTLPPTEKELNFVETGIYETNAERKAREEAEAESARIKAEEDAIKENLKDTNLDIPEEDIQEFVEIIKKVEEFVETLNIVEEVINIPEVIIIEIEEIEDELDKEIPGDDPITEDELQDEEILVEPIQEIIEEKPVEEYTPEEIEIVQEVVDNAISNVEELTEEQVEVVAEVLQVATEDVEIIAEAVKTDEVVAEAVEIFVEKAVENADVENYTLADVVTEVQYEAFLENPIKVFIDVDIQNINIADIGSDMTTDQKEKAQEVVVPVILTRIATMASFMFRKSL